ncbi:DUF3429 domain-containing protein [Piscinibacter sakaiensis]|uniref:DUF3429 domain-containing protein n=1 Tax=Piscinibacter sakaiensis TaxID=1547922 RepID=A0A0K8NTU1_PISS1|nr:DUF3429 domain-containing protein [Piscinibacter sakaiensis]GAP33836.1 hypothetical protein ISF6_1091 [Piscinibacter sakaiensis]
MSATAPAPHDPIDPVGHRLALAGLIPFVLGAALTWIVRPDAHPYVTAALSAYAALIVATLGGVHWALGLRSGGRDRARYGWGSVLPLAAWVGVMMPAYAGLVVHGTLLVAAYLVDRRAYPAHGLGPWLTMRFRLTAVAAASCFIAAAGS